MSTFKYDIDLLIKYYSITNNKTKEDINQLLIKSDKGIALSEKEIDRLNKYCFRYKMIIENVSINTDTRLNKLTRKPLTTPCKNII
jgi:hypothetical protein